MSRKLKETKGGPKYRVYSSVAQKEEKKNDTHLLQQGLALLNCHVSCLGKACCLHCMLLVQHSPHGVAVRVVGVGVVISRNRHFHNL